MPSSSDVLIKGVNLVTLNREGFQYLTLPVTARCARARACACKNAHPIITLNFRVSFFSQRSFCHCQCIDFLSSLVSKFKRYHPRGVTV